MGWIAVDLDGTLAVYNGWKGAEHIGEPIPKMVNRVKYWLEQEIEVRIMTARVGRQPGDGAEQSKTAIEQWCLEHIGTILPVTHSKDYEMIELWDDRAVQVIANTGERADRLRRNCIVCSSRELDEKLGGIRCSITGCHVPPTLAADNDCVYFKLSSTGSE